MKYYYHEDRELMPKAMDKALQKYFPSTEHGVCVNFVDGKPDTLEIYFVVVSNWTHIANIARFGDEWEVSTHFNGENGNEIWNYGSFTRFEDAVSYVASGDIFTDKPQSIYPLNY